MPDPASEKPLLRVLRGESVLPVPFWLMRQAGRYLPEYRELRAKAGSFLEFCFNPELATEATLQPIRRFATDAAILFSDILVVPYALGQAVRFEEGRGPVLSRLKTPADLARIGFAGFSARLAPVYETVRQVKAKLPEGTTLIGFAGAPWTVASYMVEGGSSRDFAAAKLWAYRDPRSFAVLIDLLTEATARHLLAQIDAGAEVVQIFDSWIGVLPEPALRRWGLDPVQDIVARITAERPGVPVIVFPKGAGPLYTAYARESRAAALGLDTGLPLDWAAENLQQHCAVQGNLDPILLLAGGDAMRSATHRILETLGRDRLIFNLGHGVVPQTPPEHVGELRNLVRDWRPDA